MRNTPIENTSVAEDDMRIALRVAAACMLLLGLSGTLQPAHAGKVTLSGTHSAADIKTHCDAVGGQFTQADAGYGCAGPGGQVNCSNKGKCTGTCPNCGSRARPGGANGVLPQSGGGRVQSVGSQFHLKGNPGFAAASINSVRISDGHASTTFSRSVGGRH